MPSIFATRALRAVSLTLFLALGLSVAQATPATLSATQIIDKHLAARGGLNAWHNLQTLSLSGKMAVSYTHLTLPTNREV